MRAGLVVLLASPHSSLQEKEPFVRVRTLLAGLPKNLPESQVEVNHKPGAP